MHFLKTHRYAPSVMREAIVNAGQFAHVPLSEIDWFLEEAEDDPYMRRLETGFWCREVSELRWPVGFHAHYTLRHFEQQYHALCPVCFTPIDETHERGVPWCELYLMPSFLYFEGADYGHGWAHEMCASGVRWLHDCVRGVERGDLSDAKQIRLFFNRRGGWKPWAEAVAERQAFFGVPLRFNPATHRHKHEYADTRSCLDIRFTREEFAALWPDEPNMAGAEGINIKRLSPADLREMREMQDRIAGDLFGKYLRGNDNGREPQLDA